MKTLIIGFLNKTLKDLSQITGNKITKCDAKKIMFAILNTIDNDDVKKYFIDYCLKNYDIKLAC